MQSFSKYFNLDTIDTNQTLKPIIVITDSDNNVLFTLAQDQDEVFNNNGDSIDIINSISKVSNVKISNDFDTKKLKINRLRCTLYNYYDVNAKLSEYVNTSIIGKNLYLFYKSPTTNIIDFSDTPSDYSCALIYTGEISRIKYNDTSIDITAEDRTQIKMSNKNVPFARVDEVLELPVQDAIFKNYKKDNSVIPMVFGSVDKAETLPYITPDNDKYVKILFDIQPTSSTFKTAKIPSLIDSTPSGGNSFYLYVKKGDDYIICEHIALTQNKQFELYSNVILQSFAGLGSVYLFADLVDETDYGTFGNWEMFGYHQRQVVSISAGDGGVMSILNTEEDDLLAWDYQNVEALNDNGGYPKKWFRQNDTDVYSGTVNFDTGAARVGMGFSGVETVGRWIILTIEKAVGDELVNLTSEGEFIGNTFLAADWEMYSNEDRVSLENSYLNSAGADRSGWFAVAIDPAIWKRVLDDFGLDADILNENLGFLLAETDEHLQAYEDMQGVYDDESIEEFHNLGICNPANPMRKCPMFNINTEGVTRNSKYWGSRGTNNGLNGEQGWVNLNGYRYGADGDTNNLKTPQESYNRIALFEEGGVQLSGSSHQQNRVFWDSGLAMNNVGIIQSVGIKDLREEKIFASIVGRKNHLFTEQINPDGYIIGGGTQLDLSLDDYLMGNSNLVNLSSEELLNLFNQTIGFTGSSLAPNLDQFNEPIDYEIEYMESIFNPNIYSSILAISYTSSMLNQHTSAFWNTFAMLKDYIWRAYLLPVKMIHLRDGLIHGIEPFEQKVYLSESEPDQNTGNFWYSLYLDTEQLTYTSYNYQTLLNNENWAKTFGKAVYQYLFQNGDFGNWEDSWTFSYKKAIYGDDYDYLGGYHSGDGWIGDYIPLQQDEDGYYILASATSEIIDVDITAEVNNKRQYAWDSFEINNVDDLLNNFYVYMDDLQQAIGNSMCEAMQSEVGFWFGYNSIDDFIDTFGNGVEILGIGQLEGSEIFIESLQQDLYNTAYNYNIGNIEGGYMTDGIINKPSDIIMNILVNEMGYAKLNDDYIGFPDYNKFDIESIEESRSMHNNWNMGFSISKQQDGKKLIEKILNETKSYPRFSNTGEFGLITIKEQYEYDDIDMIINPDEVISYKFSQTKREDVATSISANYRYDNGQNNYLKNVTLGVGDFLPDYELTALDEYKITPEDTHKNIDLRYHTDYETVVDFVSYELLNKCNPHNVIDMKLPLNYMEMSVGDILHIPLINNEKAFNVDYGVVSYVHSQPIYPLWIVMNVDIGLNGIGVKAIQLHYLRGDGLHNFQFPNQTGYEIIGNMQELNSTYKLTNGNPVPNWNFNPNANVDSGVEIPYFDVTGDGVINTTDIELTIAYIMGETDLTPAQISRLSYNADIINSITIIEMINIINNIDQ